MDIKKIMTTMILFVLMSVSLTTEKATLVWSLHILQQPDTDVITGYSILLIILGGPYLFALLQILWNVPFIANSKDPQFPGIGNVLLGCIAYSIEAACLVFFAVEVAPIFPVFLFLPILNSVLLIPTFVEEVSKIQDQSFQKIDVFGTFHWRSRYQKRLQVFACIIACFLPVALAVSLYSWNSITGNQTVVIGATLFGLSIVNCPVIQRYILAPKGRMGHKPKKITLFYTLYKICAMLLFLGIHFFNRVPERPDVTHTLTEFTEGFSNIIRPEIFLPLSLNYLSAMIAHSLAFIALSWCLPIYGILLPSVLSVTAAISACYGFLEPDLFNGQRVGELNSLVITSFITLFIWCSPYILTSSLWTKKPEYLLMPFEALFISYSWNALFFDQYLLLSCRSESSVHDSEMVSEVIVKSSADTKSRIFVCTTMYQEADYEMERLLMSLQGLSSSTKFNNVFLEAHIFMDNGCTGGTLSAFARQLVELVQVKLGLSIQNGVCLEMPYGIEILWTLNDGMPLTVHFKDSQKVKAKKRWSQAMYVHYILNFKLQTPYLMSGDSSRTSSMYSEQKVSHNMNTNLSYEEIKRSLVLDRCTEIRKYARERENQFEKWTDMFVVSKRNFDHNISQIGYPTLMSCDQLSFDRQEKEIQDQSSLQQIQARSFVESILTDSTVTQASDSLQISSVSSLTGSADEENDDGDLIDDEVDLQMRGKLSFENGAFINEELKSLNQLECPGNKKYITGSLKNNIPEMVISENNADNSKTDGDIQYSLKRTNNNNSAIFSQGMDSQVKIQENEDGSKFNIREESSMLHSKSLFELRVDNLCVSASSEENNLTESFQSVEDVENDKINEDQIYILATDADMEFKDDAVLDLLQLCNNDKRVGAACGRTYPQGKQNGPIVWHQIFEYAKDFWMIKNAQNVIGSVMCCPGCFSMYRASAIRQVMDKYVTPTRTPFTVYVKDTGEDRWMATLMMVQGWYMRYSSFARNNTFCPDTFGEFLKQRRRWVLSDIANATLVIQNLWSLMRRNACFSLCYVLYMLNMFLNNIITPGTAIVMITAGLDLVFGVPYLQTTLPLAAALFTYSIICTQCSTRMQTHITAALTIIMGAMFFAVVVWGSATIVRGIVQEIKIGNFHFQQHYIIMLITLSFGYAAIMHPSESYIVFYGFAYVFIFPAMHILLPIYSIANIIDQSWGTRDAQKAKLSKIPSLFHCIKRKKKKYFPKVSGTEETTPNCIASELKHLKEGNSQYQLEYNFWHNLRQSVIGTGVNTGLSKAELTQQLRRMRNWSLFGILTINGLWLVVLSVFYMGISSSLSKLNIYGVISGALYGFTLVIQMLGLTACRLDHLIRYVGNVVFGQRQPFWINCKE